MSDNLIMGLLFLLAALAFLTLTTIAAARRNAEAAASCGAMCGAFAISAVICFFKL